jgi:hypothetical protein
MLTALFLACSQVSLEGQVEQAAIDEAVQTAEGTVTILYDLVSSEPGYLPDWDKVRSVFIPEAVIVLRTPMDGMSVLSLEGFVADFVEFVEGANIIERGFIERVVRTKTMVMGDMAHVLVLYEAEIPDWDRPPQQGVDSWLLIKKGGRWWITGATNEIPRPGVPLPAELGG